MNLQSMGFINYTAVLQEKVFMCSQVHTLLATQRMAATVPAVVATVCEAVVATVFEAVVSIVLEAVVATVGDCSEGDGGSLDCAICNLHYMQLLHTACMYSVHAVWVD